MPLSFVAALLLVILLVAALRARETTGGNTAFLVLVALCAVQSVVVGLRWGYHVEAARYVLPILAASLPPLVLLSFRTLLQRDDAGSGAVRWLHALPPLVMIALVLFVPALIDVALIVIFVGYALAVLNLGRSGPDALVEARLDSAVAAHRALVIAAAALCLSALFDLGVLLAFEWSMGANAEIIASNANILGLFFIGLTAFVASRAHPSAPTQPGPPEPSPSEQDREILDRVQRLLVDQKLYRDDNLTLSRLARRVGVPARQISGAVNRLAGKNVSQYINDIRISEACRLLRDTDMSVTAAMLDAGFQTKSNFNREFRRVTALSPASWREQNRPRATA
ncbi:AraC family transcriptional regulator [Aminobacter sp. DSM 101952]|uniref:helix-turn-helix domain-containing protein n=1 Tax=Aminobacter sp. DSM 101952 TaxID=2735891 RepID=UPI0032997BE3